MTNFASAPWRDWGLGLYYHATLPARSALDFGRRRLGRAPICILFYHRVADRHPNPWTISRGEFTRHLNWLQRHCDLISLNDARDRIRSGINRRTAVCITFDDGYAENCDFALPTLLERSIPCTYFVGLAAVSDGEPFSHDVQAGQPLPLNTIAELRDLASAGIEIGGHTRTHCDLSRTYHPECLHDEIVASRDELQVLVGSQVRYFAFPYGQPKQLTSTAIDIVRKAGYLGYCSAFGDYNWPGGDAFHLRRIHGDPGLVRLKNWLTVDPRKRGIPTIVADERVPS